jgi:hypothetical protein
MRRWRTCPRFDSPASICVYATLLVDCDTPLLLAREDRDRDPDEKPESEGKHGQYQVQQVIRRLALDELGLR